MNEYKYTVDDPKFDQWAFDIKSTWGPDWLEGVAEEAADEYHSNHDGWESHWPCDIYIFDLSGKLLGCFVVQCEAEPVFSAKPKKIAPTDKCGAASLQPTTPAGAPETQLTKE